MKNLTLIIEGDQKQYSKRDIEMIQYGATLAYKGWEYLLSKLYKRIIHILYGNSVVRKTAKNNKDMKRIILEEFSNIK